MKTSKAFAIILFGFALPAAAATTNMQEGNWEIITSVKVEGVPFSIPPMTLTHCYTKKEIEESNNPAGVDSNNNNGCEIRDLKTTGKTSTWNMACKDGSKGSGQATYDGNSFTTTMKITDKSGGASTTAIKGKYLGKCK